MVQRHLQNRIGGITLFIVALAILIVLVLSTSTMEKSLKSIEKQNALIIELLKENRNER